MPLLQVTVTAAKKPIMWAVQRFNMRGAIAITYEDAGDQPLLEPGPGDTPLWPLIRCTGLFDTDMDPHSLCSFIDEGMEPAWKKTIEYKYLADKVWEREWLNDCAPKLFGKRLWICPAGQRPQELGNGVVVDLDPGLAFGTGSHETTALCLTWLDSLDLTGKKVLDYGCGSGILSIAAACLGAVAVTAVDYDPQALEATHANVAKNGVISRLRIYPPELCPPEQYDYVLANILANTLVNLAPQLTAFVSPGGHLALSGILNYQVEQVAAAYQDNFNLQIPQYKQEWALLTGIRRGT